MVDEVNDSISSGSSDSAQPDFNDTFGAFERTREVDEQAINRAVEQSVVYQFPPVEGYTPYDDPHADQDLVDRYLPRFLDVRSPDACRALEYKLKREESEAELVCSSGWMGAVAAASIGRPALATWTPGICQRRTQISAGPRDAGLRLSGHRPRDIRWRQRK